MSKAKFLGGAMLAMSCLMVVALAHAEPGDAQAVAKARKDYAAAMKGHDAGLQNAMKTELAYQLARAKERKKAAKNHRKPVAKAAAI